MSLITPLLSPECVLIDITANNKKRIFEEASRLFEADRGLARDLVFDKLFARERLGSTGLGEGVAIPHSRVEGLTEAAGAFIRLAAPIPFDALDGCPVNLIFVLLVPHEANETHLRILSELAMMFADSGFRKQLLAAPDTPSLHALLTGWQPAPEDGDNDGSAPRS